MSDPKRQIEFQFKTSSLQIGPYSLQLRTLADLDQTIDQVFALLEKSGQPELLEELCPYFGVLWPSGLALAQVLAEIPLPPAPDHPWKLLEIGCGLALPSLIASARGFEVTATDFHPEVEPFLEHNLRLNPISRIQYRRVDWRQPEFQGCLFDWIVGSDILYERTHPELVAKTIDRLLSPSGRVIVTDPARPYLQVFSDEMIKRGFACDTQIRKDIFILSFQRLPA